MHFVQKYILQLFFSLWLVFNLFLIFHQIAGSCSHKIILIKIECKRETLKVAVRQEKSGEGQKC